MKYRINTQTNRIAKAKVFGSTFYEENWRECTEPEIDSFELGQKKQQLTEVRLQYLKDTDWYIMREVDEPGTYPKEIKQKRILARQEISKIEKATEKTINKYSTNFEE